MNKTFAIVVAMDSQRGIGREQNLPWKLKEDMEYFRKLTSTTDSASKKNAVIMGRKTWESIPEKFRPLKDRLNIVLTKNKNLSLPEGVLRADNLDEALQQANKPEIESCFLIGGGNIYKQAINHPSLEKVYATQIFHEFSCDTFFPEFEKQFSLEKKGNLVKQDNLEYQFNVYKPASNE